MKRIVDLHADPRFQDLDVALVGIGFDSAEELAAGVLEFGIVDAPMLTDAAGEVQKACDVLKWALPSGEPSHTFVLIVEEGRIARIRDYGAPNKADRAMDVPPSEITAQITQSLGR